MDFDGLEKMMDFEKSVPLVFTAWKNEQKNATFVWNEWISNFGFLSEEKCKKIFNICFLSMEIMHSTIFKLFIKI